MTQKTRAAITSEIASLLADNGTGAITAAALRTVVQDLNDSSDITLSDNSLQVGASGTAGSVNVYPTTAANGKLIVSAINNTGAFNSTITNSNIGQSTVYSLPDPGAATANLLTDAGAQNVTGTKTFTTPVLGVASATSINKVAFTAPATSATLTIPDGVTLTGPASSGTAMTLGNAETITGNKTFGATNLIVKGSSTGATTIGTANAGASNFTLTMPAITATVAISAAPIAVGSAVTATAAQSGLTFLLDTAGGSTLTLPAATGTGNKFRVVVKTTATSAAHKILAASVSDFINGLAIGENANTCKAFASAAATNHSIQMPFAGTQPSGGFIGDYFEFTDIAANLWQCNGMYQAGTTPTTPFSSATS